MTKPQYASAEERRAARSEKAKRQMVAQWDAKRAESGEQIGYFGCHRRVRKERGPARELVCACGKQARHWAHIHDTDPVDVQNYQAMCQSCHWAYDQIGARSAQTTEGQRTEHAKLAWSRRTPEQRREIGRKIWETRRRNRQVSDAPDPALADGPHGQPEHARSGPEL